MGRRSNGLWQACDARGVQLKWFGSDTPKGFTSRHDSWRYVPAQDMAQSDAVLSGLMDVRIPLTVASADYNVIAQIIKEELALIT